MEGALKLKEISYIHAEGYPAGEMILVGNAASFLDTGFRATFAIDGLRTIVKNVAPEVLDLTAPSMIDEGDMVILSGAFQDPGILDEHKLTIDWDDPNNAAKSTFALPATTNLSDGDSFSSSSDGAVLTDAAEATPGRHVELQFAGDARRGAVIDGGAARASNHAVDQLGAGIQWQHSYVAGDKTFCVYLAKSEDDIRRHSEMSGIPVGKITETPQVIDPLTANN